MNPTVRKMAREATIFMLLFGVAGGIWLATMSSNSADAAFIAVIGFAIGLGVGLVVWALYRMVRFAIKG